MTPDPSPDLLDWIVACFNKLKTNPDFLPAYQRFILRKIEDDPDTQGLDFYKHKDSLIDPDEEDSSTHGQALENMGEEFIEHYAASRAEGHVTKYAEAYATKRLSDNLENCVSAAAYKVIGANDQEWTDKNPGYQDVLHACIAQGKDEDFAHRCARCLPDHDYFFKNAFDVTVKHDKHIAEALSKGRSATFAGAYAEAWNTFDEVEDVALSYAECFEKLLDAGRTSDDAERIAYKYANEFLDGYVDDDEGDLDFEFYKDEALAQAESAYRFRGLPLEDKKLPEIFLGICQRKYPTHHSKQWFDEIETLARSVLAGNIKLEDIQRSSYMEFLEQEALREESEKPPCFDLMTEKEFDKFNPKSEDEQDMWETEAQFREDCRNMDLDPTDPDERQQYQEILDETRDDK